MNVAFDPWIPVITLNGENKLVSLNTVFTEGENLADLAVRPHERVALMRLFLCIAHAALNGPQNYEEWCEVPKRLGEAASNYLEYWKDYFELFHPKKPWLQIASLKPLKNNDEDPFTSINKLDFSLLSFLFNHYQNLNDIEFDQSRIVLGLVTIQNFSTCGLIPQLIWDGKVTAKSAKDAPCATSSMYHVFIIADNIYKTICENICDFNELNKLYTKNKFCLGKPIWEYESIKIDDIQITQTFLGRLVPLSRAILLKDSGKKMLYGEGLRYNSFPEYTREFNTSVITNIINNNEIRILVGAKTSIHPWRQLDSILQYNLQEKTISHAIPLDHLSGEPIDIWVGALLRNPGKQDILDTVESRFHISKQLRSADGCITYSLEVEHANKISNELDKAVCNYQETLGLGNTSLKSRALSNYWTYIEKNLSVLMRYIDLIGTENVIQQKKTWYNIIYKAALDSYQLVCYKETSRQLKAFIKGWLWLASQIYKIMSQTIEGVI